MDLVLGLTFLLIGDHPSRLFDCCTGAHLNCGIEAHDATVCFAREVAIRGQRHEDAVPVAAFVVDPRSSRSQGLQCLTHFLPLPNRF